MMIRSETFRVRHDDEIRYVVVPQGERPGAPAQGRRSMVFFGDWAYKQEVKPRTNSHGGEMRTNDEQMEAHAEGASMSRGKGNVRGRIVIAWEGKAKDPTLKHVLGNPLIRPRGARPSKIRS